MITKFNNPASIATSVIRYVLFWSTSPRVVKLVGEPFFWLLGMRRKGRQIDLSQVKRILVVRLDEIGDIVMTTPFLRELRQNLSNARIALVVKPEVYNLVEFCPYVNEVLIYDWNTNGRHRDLRRHLRALKLAWRHLWKRRFDLAILPRWDADYYNGSFLVYFSGAPWRIGYSENVNMGKQSLNARFDCLFTHVLDDSTLKHEVEHNLDVIRFLKGEVRDNRLELWLGEEDEAFAKKLLAAYGVRAEDFLVGLCPGAGMPERRWPLSSFTELGAWLQKEYNARILVVGGPGEESLGNSLKQVLGDFVINTIGRTSLRQTVALLKQCRFFIGNDTGPMHLAAAVGVPVIEISCHSKTSSLAHPNSPARFHPWNVPHLVLCPKRTSYPYSNGCTIAQAHYILDVEVPQVKVAVEKLINQRDFNFSASAQNHMRSNDN